ncbi:hypothetical protein LRC39_13000 [Rhodopseudomonas sp. P1]|uniref:hypothetical protein n=1 Tax=Rhodopseudomonas sp. P1 TaxID=3434357 RepID=UPI0031FBC111
MPKSLTLSHDLEFSSITDAKKHFDLFRTGGDLQKDVPKEQFEQLKLLYDAYCKATDYTPKGEVVAFFPTIENRNGGHTRCLAARFSDGTSQTFSLDKALRAVASGD